MIIKTKKEHQLALKRIDVLWDAKRNTPAFDEMEKLITQITIYEEKHFPIEPPHVSDAIKFRLEQSHQI